MTQEPFTGDLFIQDTLIGSPFIGDLYTGESLRGYNSHNSYLYESFTGDIFKLYYFSELHIIEDSFTVKPFTADSFTFIHIYFLLWYNYINIDKHLLHN